MVIATIFWIIVAEILGIICGVKFSLITNGIIFVCMSTLPLWFNVRKYRPNSSLPYFLPFMILVWAIAVVIVKLLLWCVLK